jgi:hypothetical protein
MLLETKGSDLSEIELSAIIRNDLVLRTQDLLSELGDDVLTLQLIQARARTESVLLPEVDIKPGEAFEIARRNRRDWANARAALVDAWRQIEVVADDLESGLDLQVSGGIGNDGNNPFSLRGDNTTLRMGLQWDAPLTRIIERNNYRATLIQYERAKRDLYLFDDTVWQQLRAQIRQLQTNQITFEYGRQALRIAASQIELNSDIRELRESRGLGSGATAARDTISALNDLLGAQNDLLNTFVNFEVIRRNLTFDLGVMELTSDGLWIDPGPIDPEYLLTLPGTTGEAFADNECSQCRIPIRKQPQPPNFANDFINEPELIEFNRPVESAEELPAAAPPFVEAAEE